MIGPFCIPQFLTGLFCIVHGIGVKSVLNFKQSMVYTKNFLFKKTISMLTSLKVSSLPHKRVFYRRYHKANGEPNGTEFWRSWNAKLNIPAHIVDDKNGIICIIILFTPGVWTLKCKKWFIFCIFCWWQENNRHGLSKICMCSWKILNSFRKCCGLLGI